MTGIFCIFLFAFLAPTLSFCSLNTQFFTSAQILLSLGAAFAAGLLCAAAAVFMTHVWPSAWTYVLSSGLAAGCFLLLSERFFTETITSHKIRLVCQLALLIFCPACAALGFLWLPACLFGIYGVFALYDLARNWSRPKTPLFDPALIRSGGGHARGQAKFVHRPNVYLLLLESMHSSRAMEKAYGISTSAAEDCLASRGFTLYPDTFSNKHSTPLSLKTLLSMSLDFRARPEVLEEFRRNGYKCYFFDSMFYLSQPYATYINNKNAKMPGWVYIIYSFIGPFLTQSKWLRKLAGNIDPFETTTPQIPFPVMKRDFQTHLEERGDSPSLNILHFGAIHFGDIWYHLRNPAETYLDSYKKAVSQLGEITDAIMSRDPDALVVAVGDHGSYHWRGASDGSGAPEENCRRNGINPADLAFDFFGVLLGIRWGKLPVPATGPLSHVNIFRWVMATLSGQAAPGRLEENISILNGKHIAVRDGQPLARFEPVTDSALCDYYSTTVSNPALFQATIQLEQCLMQNDAASIEAAVMLVAEAASGTPGPQHFEAAKALVRAGHVEEATRLLESVWQKAPQVLGYAGCVYLARLQSGQKNHDRALEIINKALANPSFPKHDLLFFLMQSLWNQEKYAEILPFIPKILATPKDRNRETYGSFALDSAISIMSLEQTTGAGEVDKWLDEKLAAESGNKFHQHILYSQKLARALRLGFPQALNQLRTCFENAIIPHGFALLYLRAAILNGNRAAALAFTKQLGNFPKLQNNPLQYIMADEVLAKGSRESLASIRATRMLAQEIQETGLFDAEWYQRTYNPALPALMDYIRNGTALLRSPFSGFDMYFYLCAHPMVLLEGINPLLHYIAAGKQGPISLAAESFITDQIHTSAQKNPKEKA